MKKLKYFIILFVIVIVVVVAVKGGYVPYLSEPDPFLPDDIPESPIPRDCNAVYDDIFVYIPSAENLTHQIYNVDTQYYQVIMSYKQSLLSDGYSVFIYEDNELLGNITVGTYLISYGVFIKGITIVAVLSTADEPQGSCVLFTTGAIWEYQPILEELMEV